VNSLISFEYFSCVWSNSSCNARQFADETWSEKKQTNEQKRKKLTPRLPPRNDDDPDDLIMVLLLLFIARSAPGGGGGIGVGSLLLFVRCTSVTFVVRNGEIKHLKHALTQQAQGNGNPATKRIRIDF
jgi:hypothetical protein